MVDTDQSDGVVIVSVDTVETVEGVLSLEGVVTVEGVLSLEGVVTVDGVLSDDSLEDSWLKRLPKKLDLNWELT